MIITKAQIFMEAAAMNNTLKPTLEERKPQIILDNDRSTWLSRFLMLQKSISNTRIPSFDAELQVSF
jgi:hypothetical protein